MGFYFEQARPCRRVHAYSGRPTQAEIQCLRRAEPATIGLSVGYAPGSSKSTFDLERYRRRNPQLRDWRARPLRSLNPYHTARSPQAEVSLAAVPESEQMRWTSGSRNPN